MKPQAHTHISHITTKPAFRVSNQVQHKPGCKATEDCWRLEISDLEIRGIVLEISDLEIRGIVLHISDLEFRGIVLEISDLEIRGIVLEISDLEIRGIVLSYCQKRH